MNLDMPSAKGKTHAIVHDAWDKADFKRALREVRALGRVRKRLTDQHWTGADAVQDAFYALHKADPHLVERSAMRGSHVVNHQVIADLLTMPALKRLRAFTVGELLPAATATVELAEHLEAIFDRLGMALEAADKLQTILEHLAKDAPEDATRLTLWEEAAFDQNTATGMFYWTSSSTVATELNEAVQAAAESAAETQQTCMAWGVQPGTLERLPADERLRLARALNTPRMAQIADLFGRISNLSLSVAAEDVDDLYDEVVDLEDGSDLSRVLASEFLALADPATTPGFLARLASDELLQVTVRGSEEVGRGAIIMCIDGSGSMAIGDRDLWAKAVMLVLLHRAREQGREMHVIHFGYRQLVHRFFRRPQDFTPERIIEAAETFWASGTDFEAPMAKAVEVLQTEFDESGRTRADVVFATDGECWVEPSFMADYLASMDGLRARTWGLLVGHDQADGALVEMTEGRVFTVRDLTSGEDLRALLAGIR